MSAFKPELLGRGETLAAPGVFSRLAPLPKVCLVLGFLVLTVSFDGRAWKGSSLFAIIPYLLAWGNGIPSFRLLRRATIALPFVLCAGAANLFFDRELVTLREGVTLPGGVISFWVLIAKTLAATGMVLLLTAVTSISGISGALIRLHVPCILILQIQLLLRYLLLTEEEAQGLYNAYLLRNPGCRLLPVRDWGILCGRLFLRSVERANAVYRAMQCRLFHAGDPLPAGETGAPLEWLCCGVLLLFFAILRWRLA